MRVEKFGKRQFAFDLQWEEFRGDAPELARDKLDEEPGYFTVVTKASASKRLTLRALMARLTKKPVADADENEKGAEGVFGYAEGSFKGAVYSFAEALTKLDRDGLYLVQVEEDRFWYGVIVHGKVVPATDRTVNGDKAYQTVRDLTRAFEIPVFSSSELVKGAHHFDAQRAIEKIKLAPMRQVGKTENKLVGAVVLTAVVGAIAFGGWHFFLKKETVGESQAQVVARQRATYITAAKAALDEVPTDAAWASEAYRTAVTTFTSNIAGWSLEGFTCTTTGCTGTYVLPADAMGYAITPVYDLYGRDRVSIKGDQRSFDVTLTLEPQIASAASDEDVETPAGAHARLLDTVGRLGMQFGDVAIDGQPTTEVLNGALSAPPSMPSLFRDTVKMKHESAMELVKLRLLSAYMAESGFVATTFTVTGGAGAIKPAWNVTWVRIHGGEV